MTAPPTPGALNQAPLLYIPRETSFIATKYQSSDKLPISPFRRRRPWFIVGGALVLVALAVVLPVYFAVIKPHQLSHSTKGVGSDAQDALQIGGDGSTVTRDDGSMFIYRNPFGGYCEYIHSRVAMPNICYRSFLAPYPIVRMTRPFPLFPSGLCVGAFGRLINTHLRFFLPLYVES